MTDATEKADALIAKLNALRPLPNVPPDDWINLDRLDEILQKLWATGRQERGTAALFGIFERFPDYEDFGVFWSILHGLESLPNCGTEMIASVRRVPNEWNLSMVNRFLNGGFITIDDTNLMELLRETAVRPDVSEDARKKAQHYLEYQTPKAASK